MDHGQLWEILSEKVEEKGGVIKKGYSVKNLNIEDFKIKSVECEVDGKKETIDGDIFISSMPVKDLVQGFQGIEIPKDIEEIASNLPYRDFQTVGVLVKKLKLKNETNIKTLGNILPDCWIYVQDPTVNFGRIQIFNNWSPYLVKDPEETVWIGLEYFCNEGDDLWNMTDDEFVNLAIEELEAKKIIDRQDVIDTHREKVKKAYPAYFDTYSRMDELIAYLNKFDNLFCVGRNGQHRYNNMDHSMLTAIEATKNIKNNVREKDNVWNINVEKSYHEEKFEQ